MGCSELCSSVDAIRAQSSRDISEVVRILCTCGRPWVRVPVLSNTKRVDRPRVSSAFFPVMISERRASAPVAAVMAVGVASDNAHGQVTTNIATVTGNQRSGAVCHQ